MSPEGRRTVRGLAAVIGAGAGAGATQGPPVDLAEGVGGGEALHAAVSAGGETAVETGDAAVVTGVATVTKKWRMARLKLAPRARQGPAPVPILSRTQTELERSESVTSEPAD